MPSPASTQSGPVRWKSLTRVCGWTACAVLLVGSAAEAQLRQWDVFEKELKSSQAYSDADKYATVTLSATFAGPDGHSYVVPGFWDGGSTWRIRFAPPHAGQWTYEITSSDQEIDHPSHDGSFTAVEVSERDIEENANYRGFLRSRPGKRYLSYTDGTPFLWIGDTIWDGNTNHLAFASRRDPQTGLPVERFKTYVRDRRNKGFTIIQILIGEPTFYPAEGQSVPVNEGGQLFTAAFSEINPSSFQWFDKRIQSIVASGMVPVIFGTWGRDTQHMRLEDLQAYWRYVVARYHAYNVIWALSGDYRSGSIDEKIRPLGRFVDAIDPAGHPIGVLPPSRASSSEDFHGESWLDFHMQQVTTTDTGRIRGWIQRDLYLPDSIPVVNAEAIYERNNRNAVRRVAWTVFAAGGAGYTYGAANLASDMDDTWPDVLNRPGASDMQLLGSFLRSIEWWKLIPRADLVSSGLCLAEEGREYVVYVSGETTVSDLPRHYEASWFNPRDGSSKQAEGPVFRTPDGYDWVLHISAPAPLTASTHKR